MHILIDNELGNLILRRLRPWHRFLAGGQAWRLDRELAEGASPEASVSLAARAARLTSMEFRRDLAASLRGILVAAGEPGPGAAARASVWSSVPSGARQPLTALRTASPSRVAPGAARRPHVPVRAARVRRSAPLLADLANRLLQPGPVPAQGVAMVTQLLADGTGPLYREAARDDLGALAQQAAQALAR
jgi:hypothetical protein